MLQKLFYHVVIFTLMFLTSCSERLEPGVLAETATPVQIRVSWDQSLNLTASQRHYGLNLYKIFEPSEAVKAEYQNGLRAMRLGIVRVHRGDMMQDSATGAGWVKNPGSANYAWDKERIAATLKELPSYARVRMINIVNFPEYLKVSSDPNIMQLRPNAYDAYAAFCAELVRIVNVELKLNVQYWEVMNELDDSANKYDNNMAEVGRIFNKAAAAMKAVDPSIKVGGPAIAQTGKDNSRDELAFLQVTKDTLDFFSFHTYSTGDGNLPLSTLWNNAANLKNTTAGVQAAIRQTTNRRIQTFHDEYNISWAPPDPRMTNEIGAVFDALALESFVTSGVTGALAWNEADGWYGKMGNEYDNYKRRPSSYVYELYNKFLAGGVVASSSSDDKKVDSFAVSSTTSKAVALVNRALSTTTPVAQRVQVSFQGWTLAPTTALRLYQITASGLKVTFTTPQALAQGLDLPAASVTVIVQK